MGTRADFYVGKNQDAKWIGSIGYDGYISGIDDAILKSTNEDSFYNHTMIFLKSKKHSTMPETGWPWAWETSSLTDFSYWFFDNHVWVEFDGLYVSVKEAVEMENYCDWWEWWDDKKKNEGVEKYEKVKFPEFSTENYGKSGGPASGILLC